jgi:Protein of unknown function (DUF4239)
MNSDHVSLIAFVVIFGGGITGIVLRRVLPQEHFVPASEAVIKLVTGFVMTMTGIILGMLVSSAKASYDGQKLLVAQMSSEVILLDRALAAYGPETDAIRIQGRQALEVAADRVWPSGRSAQTKLHPEDTMDRLEVQLNALNPKTVSQTEAKTHSMALLNELRQANWLLFVQSDTNKLSMPLLVILICWVVAIFISFGLYAPPNPTVIVTILFGALAVSAAIFIIVEMYSPFSGVMKLSSDPIREAIAQMGH